MLNRLLDLFSALFYKMMVNFGVLLDFNWKPWILQISYICFDMDLHTKYWKNKLQALTKTIVTHKHWAEIYTIVFAINRGIDYWVVYLCSIFLHCKHSEEKSIMKDHM